MRHTLLFHHGIPARNLSVVILVLGPLLWLPCLWAASPITPSGLHTQVSDPITLPANHIQYDITGGTRPGGAGGTNLFHSFGDFSVPTNNIANFLNAGSVDLNGNVLAPNLPTSNILGRVTGVDPSAIFGTIQTNGTGGFGNANLFLMNPHGFLFGPNATVNVGGMMTFTTADYLRFQGTDTLFNKVSTPESLNLLSTVPVAAFGFLGSNPAAIAIQGSTLQVAQGQSLSFLGGNEGFKYIDPDTGIRSSTTVSGGVTMTEGTLLAPGGQVNIASVASPGEILVGTLAQAANINGQSFGALGSIQVSQRSNIDVSGDGGGTVLIRGGQFVLDNSTISANVTDSGPIIAGVESIGHGIDIVVRQDAVIQNGAILETNVMGNASPSVQYSGVHVKADRIEILGSQDFENLPVTGIFSSVAQDNTGGSSGDIKLEANSILVKEFGAFTTFLETATDGAGNSGNILVNASGNLEMDGVVFVNTFSGNAASGNAGNIEFTSTGGNILLTNGPNVSSQSGAFSSGSVGSIVVNAPNGDILLAGNPNNGPAVVFTHIDGTGPNAGMGGIQLSAKNLTIENSGIQIDNFTPFQPGDLTVNLTGTLNLSGTDIPSTLLTTTRRSAQSADLNITAPDILLADGSRVSAETYRDGNGGTLSIFTQHLELTSGAQITSGSIFNPNLSRGDPPETPSGAGGTITIQGLQSPAESVLIDGTDSGIFTNTEGTGAGGNIDINANSVTLQNRGAMSAQTSGKGNAGNITIAADQVSLTDLSKLTASSSGQGAGGTIHVSAKDTIRMVDSFIFASSNSIDPNAGSGGRVILNAPTIDVVGGDIRTATVGSGNAGDVQIQAGTFRLGASENASGLVEAPTSGSGHGGNISILGIDGPGSRANDVILSDSSSLRSETSSKGAGTAGNITVDTVRLTLREGSEITTASLNKSPGNAGNVTLDANESVLVSGSFVTSDVSGASTGNGGQVIIKTPNLIVNQRSDGAHGQISTGTGSSGNAGSVTINADSVTLTNGGRVTSSSFLDDPINPPATGAAGTVVVQGIIGAGSQANSIVINGQDGSGAASGIFTNTDGSGRGGSIALFANSVALQNGGTLSAATSGTSSTAIGGTIMVEATNTVTMNSASITASSKGTADAGNIDITSPNGFTMQNSTITTQGGPGASGGNIKVTTSPSATMLLENSKISASVADGRGGGGNISIDPQYVILQNSQILAKAADGQGGAITITANLFLPDANSIVNADANPGSGVNGTVTIQSPNAPISGHIQPLDKSPLIATSLLNQHCASLAGGEFSSFTVAGRDSLPTEPGSWLASPLATLDAGMGLGAKAEGVRPVARGDGLEGDAPILSLRKIAPAGFLTQAFAVERSSGCQS